MRSLMLWKICRRPLFFTCNFKPIPSIYITFDDVSGMKVKEFSPACQKWQIGVAEPAAGHRAWSPRLVLVSHTCCLLAGTRVLATGRFGGNLPGLSLFHTIVLIIYRFCPIVIFSTGLLLQLDAWKLLKIYSRVLSPSRPYQALTYHRLTSSSW